MEGTQNLAFLFSPNHEWIEMSWTLSSEYIQPVSAFPQPRLAAWWHVTALLFPLLLGLSFCHHLLLLFIPLPAIPAFLQPPAFSDLVGDAATSFALSLLVLPVPGCLQTCVLVPSDLESVLREGPVWLVPQAWFVCNALARQSSSQHGVMRVFPVWGCLFFLQLQHLTLFANGDS